MQTSLSNGSHRISLAAFHQNLSKADDSYNHITTRKQKKQTRLEFRLEARKVTDERLTRKKLELDYKHQT